LYRLYYNAVELNVLESELNKNGRPCWEPIINLAASAGIEKFLLPSGTAVPEKLRGRQCQPNKYQRHYCFRIARQFSRELYLSQNRSISSLKIAVLDYNGFDTGDTAIKASTFFSDVKLITCKKNNIAYIQDRAISSLGRQIDITDDLTALKGRHFILAPYGVDDDIADIPQTGLLISAKPIKIPWSGLLVDGFEPELPEALERLRPPDVGKLEFAAAMWQDGGYSPLGMLPVSKLLSKGEEINKLQIVSLISALDS
jgi:hypothetical protein